MLTKVVTSKKLKLCMASTGLGNWDEGLTLLPVRIMDKEKEKVGYIWSQSSSRRLFGYENQLPHVNFFGPFKAVYEFIGLLGL